MKYHIDPSKLVIHDKLVKKQEFLDNGILFNEIYYLNNKLHNPDAPAYLAWYEDGQVRIHAYYLNGKRHNPNGPAYQLWHASGRLFREEYYLNGIYYSKREYDKLAKSYYNIHSE